MATPYQHFKSLHYQDHPLLIGNVWNVQSARVYEESAFSAIATSSAAVAHSLGYEDGEQMPFEEYLFIIGRIAKSVSLPLSVDLEGGYGEKTETIVSNMARLQAFGVVGINIEDSVVVGAARTMREADLFAAKLMAVTGALKAAGIDMFLNVRSDVYLSGLGDALSEAKRRVKYYEAAGADGIFLPGITSVSDLGQLTALTDLPVNVMCVPGLPDFETLQRAGVKRISMGNFVNNAVYRHMQTFTQRVVEDQRFACLF